MKLKDFLLENRVKILDAWKATVFSVETQSNKWAKKMPVDPFTNPMVHTVYTELESLVDIILGSDADPTAALDGIIRIKAVQEESPTQALSFLFKLKEIIRKRARDMRVDEAMSRELVELDVRIDDLGLRGFDIYMQCREQLFQIKLDEFKRNNFVGFDETMSCSSKTVEDQPKVDFELFRN
jgi:hypothetical protein